jgi:PhnB protein
MTMTINPYLNFNGNCAEAFKFYEKCLGAKILMMMTHGDSPMASQTPPGWKDKIMHARLVVDDQVLMGSDAPPDHFHTPQGFSIAIGAKEPAEADRIFSALSDGGSVSMPIQETFWARRFGMFVDKFGIAWMVNCEKPMQ